uniref:MCP four helix bundle domain-containing protein n=1 Tax=Clostridium sp. NkU-1 TaxID=1095009 RepID=UPI003260843A
MGKKLILGFGVILMIIIASTALSALNTKNLGFQVERYYRYTVPNTNSTWTMRSSLASAQKYLLQAILDNDMQSVQNSLLRPRKRKKAFPTHWKPLSATSLPTQEITISRS